MPQEITLPRPKWRPPGFPSGAEVPRITSQSDLKEYMAGPRRWRDYMRKHALTTLELPFTYTEHGETKSALVKAVLCARCLGKMMWKRRKEKERAAAKEGPNADGGGGGSRRADETRPGREDRHRRRSSRNILQIPSDDEGLKVVKQPAPRSLKVLEKLPLLWVKVWVKMSQLASRSVQKGADEYRVGVFVLDVHDEEFLQAGHAKGEVWSCGGKGSERKVRRWEGWGRASAASVLSKGNSKGGKTRKVLVLEERSDVPQRKACPIVGGDTVSPTNSEGALCTRSSCVSQNRRGTRCVRTGAESKSYGPQLGGHNDRPPSPTDSSKSSRVVGDTTSPARSDVVLELGALRYEEYDSILDASKVCSLDGGGDGSNLQIRWDAVA
ncbi:hypothetical protein FB45DRAFT_858855 [Roridomyces roridus]|uniref:Uncharacterized protein n=1 Tax=Roridomyces roridus TaxID=1738132 RepID=A0AAD7CKI3_9AGAR|nr:hypothetical protein FB45DRAFT_858855 [Roridomyces roridus]